MLRSIVLPPTASSSAEFWVTNLGSEFGVRFNISTLVLWKVTILSFVGYTREAKTEPKHDSGHTVGEIVLLISVNVRVVLCLRLVHSLGLLRPRGHVCISPRVNPEQTGY